MRRLGLVLLLVAAVLIAIGFTISRTAAIVEPEDPELVTIDIPPDHSYGGAGFGRQLDISPDGKTIVYVGRARDSRQIYVQVIGQGEPSALAGTEEAAEPTFSPDGRHVAFYADGNVKKAATDGSQVSVIAKATPPRGIAWLDADTLILGNTQGALLRISVSQGDSSPLTSSMGPHLPHLAPGVLPGSKAVLFTTSRGSLMRNRIGVLSLDTGEERELLDESAFAPRYVPTGHIIFASGNERTLMAARFDLEKLSIVGTPKRILETLPAGQGYGGSTDYAFSASGALIYTPRREDSIDEVVAFLGNINLTQIHVQSNWFDKLKSLVP